MLNPAASCQAQPASASCEPLCSRRQQGAAGITCMASATQDGRIGRACRPAAACMHWQAHVAPMQLPQALVRAYLACVRVSCTSACEALYGSNRLQKIDQQGPAGMPCMDSARGMGALATHLPLQQHARSSTPSAAARAPVRTAPGLREGLLHERVRGLVRLHAPCHGVQQVQGGHCSRTGADSEVKALTHDATLGCHGGCHAKRT